jgi:hypothetical protein
MELKLKIYRKDGLLAEVHKFAQLAKENNHEIPVPDRIAIRHRQALLCWFCMYHPEVLSDDFSLDISLFLSARHCKNSERQINPTAVVPFQMEFVDKSSNLSNPDTDFWDTVEWETEFWAE